MKDFNGDWGLGIGHGLIALLYLPFLRQVRKLRCCFLGLCKEHDAGHRPVQTVDHRQVGFLVRIPSVEEIVLQLRQKILTIGGIRLGRNAVGLHRRQEVFVFKKNVRFHIILPGVSPDLRS